MGDEVKGIKNQQLVSFKIGSEEFGINIMNVQEIIRMQEITKVPQMPGFIEGILNLRGNVIPIVDLRKKFDLSEVEKTVDSRIIVVSMLGRIMGIIVDSVSEVLRMNEEQIQPPPSIISSIGQQYIKGVGKLGQNRLLIMLEIDKILSLEEYHLIDKAI